MTDAIGTRAPTATPTGTEDVALPSGRLRAPVERRALALRASLSLADALAAASALSITALLFGDGATSAVAIVPLVLLCLKALGLYKREPLVVSHPTLDEVPQVVAAAAVSVLVVYAAGLGAWHGSELFILWANLALAIVVARFVTRAAMGRALSPERVLLIGTDSLSAAVRRKLGTSKRARLVLLGRLGPATDERVLHDRWLGEVSELADVVAEWNIERVLVDARSLGLSRTEEVVRNCHALGVRVELFAPLAAASGVGAVADELDGIELIALREFGPGRGGLLAKRALDVTVAGLLLLLLAPLMLVIAVAIKLTSRGPVFFRQIRIGREGRPFQMLKFRTMVEGADRLKPLLLDLNQAAEPLFKIANDPRTTKVGRFLRCYSLDELPQLLNVLRGEMSLVGPRPLVPEEDRFFKGWQRARHVVAPGITGPWQILGSSRVPLEEMVAIDYRYCASWSLWQDIKILARTLPYVLSRQSGEHHRPRRG
ncbi:exopolysaccharide biosynthesis polyprenyl glycosylphosphotransferase [Thermoleophilum album]|jgi:exopolysaccharide biosynthesis polyprenyl glycosylphosphotransferase|uniref:exopolysaccharide biosynthesis polyprenyl glycosylphosphotransferase n=1 Tax=Thermoleophilum album TaxID=29539 RepID=UPI00237CCC03|nr:exopolysaccharide biosynthesis polyprenyl glycosylphosphotransferase [Thermoleophilum album]MCL6440080.1 exopolysaccharide biosynthesis polyprenyl glycosylphosphotransferase [Thermoleophilum sp.]WDT94127.1 exopolysaccharide biosynthesis polyprenyl glycosylphosphotransferase [Thermoleophilum album]